MSYLGKLNPSIGGGLGGLPERSEVKTADVVQTSMFSRKKIYTPIASTSSISVLDGYEGESYENIYPIVYGNDIFFTHYPNTSVGKVLRVNIDNDTITAPSYITGANSYNLYSRNYAIKIANRYYYYGGNSYFYYDGVSENGDIVNSGIISNGSIIEPSGTFTYDSSAYGSYSSTYDMASINQDEAYVISGIDATYYNGAGLFILDKNTGSILKSRDLGFLLIYRPIHFTAVKKTSFGYVLVALYKETSSYQTRIRTVTFDNDLNIINNILTSDLTFTNFVALESIIVDIGNSIDDEGYGITMLVKESSYYSALADVYVKIDSGGTVYPVVINNQRSFGSSNNISSEFQQIDNYSNTIFEGSKFDGFYTDQQPTVNGKVQYSTSTNTTGLIMSNTEYRLVGNVVQSSIFTKDTISVEAAYMYYAGNGFILKDVNETRAVIGAKYDSKFYFVLYEITYE